MKLFQAMATKGLFFPSKIWLSRVFASSTSLEISNGSLSRPIEQQAGVVPQDAHKTHHAKQFADGASSVDKPNGKQPAPGDPADEWKTHWQPWDSFAQHP